MDTYHIRQFPSTEHRESLRQKLESAKWDRAIFTDAELWFWHAYDYGFRRVYLGSYARMSPLDEKGDWFDGALVSDAEDFYLTKCGRKRAKPITPATSSEAIRTNWKDIPWSQLTEAERGVAGPHVERMAREAKANIAAATERWQRKPRPPAPPCAPAREIPPPLPRNSFGLKPDKNEDKAAVDNS